MKKFVPILFIFTLVLITLSIRSAYSDDNADLNKLQPLSSEENKLYRAVKDDPVALHKFVVTRIYLRQIDQLCPPNASKDCYKIEPLLPDDADAKYAVTFDEQILYLQATVVRKGKELSENEH